MNSVNRYHFTDKFMKGLKIALKKGYKNDFISKFKPKLKGDDIFVGDKKIIPRSELQIFLEKQLKGESPTGIRSMQAYLSNNFVGVTRGLITKFLSEHPQLQTMKTRPRISKKADKHKKGSTGFILDKYPNTLGMDTIKFSAGTFPDRKGGGGGALWFGKKNLLNVAVHKASGYVWIQPLTNANAKNSLKHLKEIMPEIKKNWGPVDHIEVDMGKEYYAEFKDYCEKQGIPIDILDLVSYVEKKNSHIQRTLKILYKDHSFAKAINLCEKKLNNTRNETNLYNRSPEETKGKKKFKKRHKQRTGKGLQLSK